MTEDHQERQALLVRLVQLVLPVHLDLADKVEDRVHLGSLVREVYLAPRENSVHLDHLVPRDRRVTKVKMVRQVILVREVHQDLQATPDPPDHRVSPDQEDSRVIVVLLETTVLQVNLVLMVHKVHLVPKEITVHPDLSVYQVHLVLLVHLVFQDKARLSTNQTSRVLASLTAEASFSQKTAEPSLEDSLMLRRGWMPG